MTPFFHRFWRRPRPLVNDLVNELLRPCHEFNEFQNARLEMILKGYIWIWNRTGTDYERNKSQIPERLGKAIEDGPDTLTDSEIEFLFMYYPAGLLLLRGWLQGQTELPEPWVKAILTASDR